MHNVCKLHNEDGGAPPRRVLLLCGGRSDEHQVSLESARSVMDALGSDVAGPNGGRVSVVPMVITRDGAVVDADESRRLLAPTGSRGGTTSGELASRAASTVNDALLLAFHTGGFDVVFPLLHGPYGEDGSVQGLLKVMGVPFVGTDVLGSAVGMDKLAMKAVFAANGLPQVRHVGVNRHAFARDRAGVLAGLEELGLPLFVKPANLGSSIGITKVVDAADLASAIDVALRFDRRVVVEEAANGARELEVAVLGNDRPATSVVGEIRYQAGFYDYTAKYTDGQAELLIPADVPADVGSAARALALQAFAAIDAAGLARVDVFYLPDGRLLVNEINTMPGFTRHSMYPKLWEASGLPYPDLVTRLVDLALESR